MYGAINLARIDTEPGGSSTFSPPSGWEGDYRQYLREKWKNDPGFRQHAGLVGMRLKRGETVQMCGRYADEAMKIVKALFR